MQDALELDAAGHQAHEDIIRRSVEQSLWALTVHTHGELACIFGVVPGGTLLAPEGVPWMLGTDEVPRRARVLQRMAPVYVGAMLLEFPRLSNTVHARNTVAVRWLRRLGFTMGRTFQHPITGEPFMPFWKSRGHV